MKDTTAAAGTPAPRAAISDKHLKEMSPARDFPSGTRVRMRYAILSSPRSGSTLLGRVLHETGMAGDPQEYFNPPLLRIERERSANPALNINEFIRRMEARRTSPNGVFGMKMHYSQMLGVFGAKKPNPNMVRMLRGFQSLIWIRRRDRIGQAISQAIALRTNVWSSEDSRFRKDPEVNIHPYDCINTLRAVAGDDAGWEQLLRATGLPVLEVWYEDLVAQYEPQTRRVLEHLGISGDVPVIPPQPLEKQAGVLNERLRRELLAYLGAGTHPSTPEPATRTPK